MTNEPSPPDPPTSRPPGHAGLGMRLFGEFAVIVSGVLVALAVDSWVERAAEARRETALLDTLRGDLEASAEDLRRETDRIAEQVDRLEWFLAFPIDGSVEFPMDSLLFMTVAANVTNTYSPVLRTYDALVSTGELDLVQDREIRFDLAMLRKQADGYLDFRQQATDGWNLTLKDSWLRWMGEGTAQSPLPPPDVLGALRDREFRGVLFHRMIFLSGTATSGEELLGAMTRLQEKVEAELADRG